MIVTHGAQQALDLIGRVLIGPDDCVAVEEPGYTPVRRLFESLGAALLAWAERRGAVVIEDDYDSEFRFEGRPLAGLHVAARVAPGASVDVTQVVRRARESGVAVESLRRFYSEGPGHAGLVIGYGAIPTTKVDEGLRRLAASLMHTNKQRARPRRTT